MFTGFVTNLKICLFQIFNEKISMEWDFFVLKQHIASTFPSRLTSLSPLDCHTLKAVQLLPLFSRPLFDPKCSFVLSPPQKKIVIDPIYFYHFVLRMIKNRANFLQNCKNRSKVPKITLLPRARKI